MTYTKEDLASLGARLYGEEAKDYAPKLASLLGMTERHLRRLLNGTQEISSLRQGQLTRIFEIVSHAVG